VADYQPIRIGNAIVGGPLGATTGLVVGSIFYDKHSIVADSFEGKPDRFQDDHHRHQAGLDRKSVV